MPRIPIDDYDVEGRIHMLVLSGKSERHAGNLKAANPCSSLERRAGLQTFHFTSPDQTVPVSLSNFPRTPSRHPSAKCLIFGGRASSKTHISTIDFVWSHRVARTHAGSFQKYSRAKASVFLAMKLCRNGRWFDVPVFFHKRRCSLIFPIECSI